MYEKGTLSDCEEFARFDAEIDKLQQTVGGDLDQLGTLIKSPKGMELHAKLVAARTDYGRDALRAQKLLDDPKSHDEAVTLLNTALKAKAMVFFGAVKALMDYQV
ncbi:MAG: hypothetical protein MO853_11235 [Candidatus Protistobacter heckmanni]|nr:hypothetical protein [Candidatus Protistobacter heckmanni]